MKPEEKKKLILDMRKAKLEYPTGLEKFLPIDEEAINILEDDFSDKVNDNIEKYFLEQKTIKDNIQRNIDEINKMMVEYQENCKKLVDYLKELKI